MSSVNKTALLNTLNKYLNSEAGKKKIKSVSSGGSFENAEAAGRKFADILRQEIADNTALSTNVKAALDCVSYHAPQKLANGQYEVEVYFTNDLSRPSLRPPELYPGSKYVYDPINSLVQLYNNGVDHTMNRIWGTWGNREGVVGNKQDIPAAHFVQSAISKFDSAYSPKYGVIEIEADGFN